MTTTTSMFTRTMLRATQVVLALSLAACGARQVMPPLVSPERVGAPLAEIEVAAVQAPVAEVEAQPEVHAPALAIRGNASFYGWEFAGRLTANGERYDPLELTAAHRFLPFGTCLEVTRSDTGRSVRVRVNDRGPYVDGRMLDLSIGAARRLGMMRVGVAAVLVRDCDEES